MQCVNAKGVASSVTTHAAVTVCVVITSPSLSLCAMCVRTDGVGSSVTIYAAVTGFRVVTQMSLCAVCQDGWWGQQCNYTCGSNCVSCDHANGSCAGTVLVLSDECV